MPASVSAKFREFKAEYAAGLPSRFRRTRSRLGGVADSHIASNQQFWSIREYARDMDRNDPLVGQLVDRAVLNDVQDGYKLTPDTGDKKLDAELRDLWREYAEDPNECDLAGKWAFPEIERFVKRAEYVDGDFFIVLGDDGKLQLVEGDHVDSPMALGGDVIHGVKINEVGKALEYWFVKPRPFARFSHQILYASPDGYDKRPAFDDDGQPIVLHVFNPKRVTQSRGITAFAAIFDYLGMIEDVNFATLVKQQIAACLAAFIERSSDFKFGARTSETQADYTTQTLEELSPGTVVRGAPGEKMQMFSPNVPTPEFFQHLRFLLRVVGCQLGMPLELVLLDMTETNFSGHRAAMNEARMGFRVNQSSFARRFHSPVYRFKARRWLAEKGLDPTVNRRLLRHTWRGRGWPYIDPLTDANADKVRLDNLFISPRDLADEHGEDYDAVIGETVEDKEMAIRKAQEAAARVSTKESPVTWRDILGLSTPQGVSVTSSTATTPDAQTADKGGKDKKGNNPGAV